MAADQEGRTPASSRGARRARLAGATAHEERVSPGRTPVTMALVAPALRSASAPGVHRAGDQVDDLPRVEAVGVAGGVELGNVEGHDS
jgi:hypothetical protein